MLVITVISSKSSTFLLIGSYYRVRTRFGIYEKVLKMTVPISRPGKGLEMRQKHEKSMEYHVSIKAMR